MLMGRPAPAALPEAQVAPRPMIQCRSEAAYGFPRAQKIDTIQLCRKGYALEYDNQAKIPIWASYLLTPIETTGCTKRSNDFKPDLSLNPAARSTKKDYENSGYDKGHMVNDGDMRWDSVAEDESFLMSNMAPQLPEFNRGIWKRLEDSTRGWTLNRQHPIQVYVGPIYDKNDQTIGQDHVVVPHGFWKILIDTQTNEVMVFKFKHEGSKDDLSSFLTTLADVQKDTGLVLPMPDKVKFSPEMWPRIVKSVARQKNIICSLKPH